MTEHKSHKSSQQTQTHSYIAQGSWRPAAAPAAAAHNPPPEEAAGSKGLSSTAAGPCAAAAPGTPGSHPLIRAQQRHTLQTQWSRPPGQSFETSCGGGGGKSRRRGWMGAYASQQELAGLLQGLTCRLSIVRGASTCAPGNVGQVRWVPAVLHRDRQLQGKAGPCNADVAGDDCSSQYAGAGLAILRQHADCT